jgi:hypothetical protein
MSDMADRVIEFFRGHKRAYQQTFNRASPAAQYVLADIANFCHAKETTLRPGATELELARNEGRRQVFLRIQRALNLTPEEMFDLARQAKEIVK